ncbi:VENN motif pre-toxin domain-containing protein [Cupriavidus gilardii]|uniref:VENN motif pre-toxin domain-containing protein n=1 Tax=Cupriavidus gilardii TaxID=82541 RepID=UPI0034A02C8A
MLAGGGVSGVLGADEEAAAEAAQNEALNNYLSVKQEKGLVDSLKSCSAGDIACVEK